MGRLSSADQGYMGSLSRQGSIVFLVPSMLTRAERVSMMDQILSKLAGRQDGEPWDLVRANTVFEGFGLDAVYVDMTGDYLDTARRALHGADNPQLSEMYEYMFTSASVGVVDAADGVDEGLGMWEDGHVRVFLSHSAHHKKFVAEVAEKMRIYMLDGFVAHDSIEPTREWQDEIERGLRTAQIFVGLVHPEFNDSAWTNQEVGWAKGRELPIYMIRFGADPRGFLGKVQWPAVNGNATQVAAKIARWVNSLPQYSNNIGGRLLDALRASSNYPEAGDAAQVLNAFDALTDAQFIELDSIYLENTQVHGGALAHRGLKPLYARHKRDLPPSPLRRRPEGSPPAI